MSPEMKPKLRNELKRRFVALLGILLAAPPCLRAQTAGGAVKPDAAEQPGLKARALAALSQVSGEFKIDGLQQPVSVLRDRWGVAHIYAQNQHDLFFAQGFVAAQDRLFQMELWKRSGQGRLAEILGPSALQRDVECAVAELSRRHEAGTRKLFSGHPGDS